MPFTYEVIQYRGEDCIEITGYEGTLRSMSVPDEIEGLPVRSIGKHAFAGRRDLEEVSLPDTVRRLSLFAFHNCAKLRGMRLYDSIGDYYDGAIRQCTSLEEIEMVCRGGSYALMKEMLGDNDKEMSFLLHLEGEENQSEDIRLSFPDYALIASENTMARTIQFAYEGGGYAYRNCVRKREIRFREYDRLFSFMERDDASFAAVIASDRLMFPHDLDEAAKRHYTQFLTEHAEQALERFIRSGQIDRVRLLTERGLADSQACAKALRIASELGETAICAVLMESGRETAGKNLNLSMELEDW